jgi:PAS domain S-box-containing protein
MNPGTHSVQAAVSQSDGLLSQNGGFELAQESSQATAIALEKERELHSIITKTMAEGICLVRLSDGTIVYANPKFEQMFGYGAGELEGQPVAIVNYEQANTNAQEVYEQIVQSVLQTGEATYEVMNVRKNGTPFWCQATTSMFEHPDHGTVLVAVQQDITARKQAEAEIHKLNAELSARVAQRTAQLALSNQRYANLTQLSPVGIFCTDVVGKCLYVNDRWCEITGLSPADVMANGWASTLHPGDQERVFEAWHQTMQFHTPFQLEYRFQRSDGKLTWVFGQAIPETNQTGEIVGYIGTITDISDRKGDEAELQKRTAELTQLNTLLATTATLLEERNRELDQFAYMASHDLKAPLRAIANLSEWIEEDLDGQLPPENQHQMQLLRSRVHRMDALINGLLQFSRIGRSEAIVEPVELAELCNEILDSLAPPASFTIQLPPALPTLNTRRVLLQQVLMNLLNNAVKHHDRPDGTVTLALTERGAVYEFQITDDGPGIDPTHHDRIFEMFQTLDARDTKENTGVGLAIVKKIVESEGGQISVRSQVGQGTTFQFTWLKQPKSVIR